MMYLVDGWQPVLYHRYGCDFGNTVVNHLPSVVFIQLHVRTKSHEKASRFRVLHEVKGRPNF